LNNLQIQGLETMQARALIIRLIRVAVVASVVLPCLLFAFASWTTYRNIHVLADERLIHSLDVQQEEAANTFELVELTMRNSLDLVEGMSAQDIGQNSERLHVQLKKISQGVALVQSIWIYGANGRSLVTSRVHPPPAQDYSDRDFFRVHVNGDGRTYYGQVYTSDFSGEPFFTVSRRIEQHGKFIGVLEVSVLPSNFFKFFSALAYAQGLQYALLREDGLFMARYPQAPPKASDRLGEQTGFRRTVALSPKGGFYSSISPIDGIDRRFAIRRLDGTPLYLTAGVENATLRTEWMTTMASHLIFGVPATLFLFLTLLTVLRRTQRLYAEVDRRSDAENALRQSQKMEAIGQLTGGVAHDFNNLLTIIIGNLEGLQRQLESADVKVIRQLKNAIHGAQRAATLTKRLLAFSRQQPLAPTPIDINRLLNGLADFLQRALGEAISLEVVGGGGLWSVEADAAELESALVNLAVNARDAMTAGGELTIEASNSHLDEAYCQRNPDVRPGQYVLISVSDNGIGMSREILARAFEPFFTTKQAGQGTGLGLSQVYGFVKQSGGHVNAYSEVGEGTTVKIYLPRFYGEVPEPDKQISGTTRSRANECILVVEDDGDVRSYIVETLGDLGYEVLEAKNGEDALRLMAQYRNIHLLLTDVVMPGMNGRELAEEALQRHPLLKVLYMTGYSRNAIVHQGRLDAGVNLIQKPLASEQLSAMVRRVLDGKLQQDGLR
jgi:signal transduction histidine kinase/CheY-like chemotaxis protein